MLELSSNGRTNTSPNIESTCKWFTRQGQTECKESSLASTLKPLSWPRLEGSNLGANVCTRCPMSSTMTPWQLEYIQTETHKPFLLIYQISSTRKCKHWPNISGAQIKSTDPGLLYHGGGQSSIKRSHQAWMDMTFCRAVTNCDHWGCFRMTVPFFVWSKDLNGSKKGTSFWDISN